MPISARPGEHVQFTVWNQPFGGSLMRLLFIFIGAAPLKLGLAPGAPDPAPSSVAMPPSLDPRPLCRTGPLHGSDAYRDAIGEAGRAKNAEVFREVVDFDQTNHFRFSPKMSFVPKAWVDADPAFWTPPPPPAPAPKKKP